MTKRFALLTWLILIFTSAAGSLAEPNPSRPELEAEIISDLSAGRDVTEEAILYSRLQTASVARRPALAKDRGIRDLTASLEGLRQELSAGAKTANDARIIAAYRSFEIQDLLLRDELETTAARLQELAMKPDVHDRMEAAKTAYLELSDHIHATLRTATGKADKDSAPAVGELLERLSFALSDTAPAVLRNSLLPYRRQSLPARAPVVSPAIVPSYLLATEVTPSPEDLSPHSEAPFTNEILGKAAELGYDYVAIFEFVRNEIATEWYAGARQGAVTTLRRRAGNDADQATLLAALLRASSVPVRYVRGVIEMPWTDFGERWGIADPNQVGDFLARSGIAHAPVIRGGTIAAYQIEHLWVSAYLPYNNYRGAVVDFSGKTWLPLMPAIRGYERTGASGVLDAMGFDSREFLAGYLATPQLQDPMTELRAEVEVHLLGTGSSWEDQLAVVSPSTYDLGLLPNSLPATVVAVTSESAVLEDELRQRVRWTVRAGADDAAPVILEHELPLHDAAGRRMTISYVPATADDHRLVNAWGGLERVPAYLVRLRPRLRLEGRSVAVAEESLPMALPHRFEIELIGPGGTERVVHDTISGSYHAFAVGPRSFPENVIDDPEDTEYEGVRLLSSIAYNFSDGWTAAEDELTRLFDITVAQPLPSVAIVSNAMAPVSVLGLPHRLEWQGVTLDAALRIAEPISSDNPQRAIDWMRLSALHGSALEHRLFESQFQVESISADKALGLARAQGLEVLIVDAGNVDELLPSLQHPEAVRREVEAWVNLGLEVEIPRLPINLNAWQGSAWRVEDPATGAAGYFLAGGLAGGATTEAPSDWILAFVAAALAHTGPAPNTDPFAGTELLVVTNSDQQLGEVGEPFEMPVAFQVLDEDGIPVQGAQVTMELIYGGGLFRSEGGGLGASMTGATDAFGIASGVLIAGTDTDSNPAFGMVHPDDEQPTKVLKHVIVATAQSSSGPLELPQPLIAFALPGPASEIERIDFDQPIFNGLQIGIWSDTPHFKVEDEYGNDVANAELEVTARDIIPNIEPVSCAANGTGADAENLLFFDATGRPDGSFAGCPSTTFPTRVECGEEKLRVRTDAFGEALVGVITGNTHLAGYTALVEVRQIDLQVSITESQDPVEIPELPEDPEAPEPPPEIFEYQIQVSNHGSHEAENVRVEVHLDLPPIDTVSVQSIDPSQGQYTQPWWIVGSLDAGSTATLKISLEIEAGTFAARDLLGIEVEATSPGDPVILRLDDKAEERTSIKVIADPTSDSLSDPVKIQPSVPAAKNIEILSFEQAYRVPLVFGDFEGVPCIPNINSIQVRGFLPGAATLVGEPYPLPIEIIYFNRRPSQCVPVEFPLCDEDEAQESPEECRGFEAECVWDYRSPTRAAIFPMNSEIFVTLAGSETVTGSATPLVPSGNGSVFTTIAAGPEIGLYEVTANLRIRTRQMNYADDTLELVHGWGEYPAEVFSGTTFETDVQVTGPETLPGDLERYEFSIGIQQLTCYGPSIAIELFEDLPAGATLRQLETNYGVYIDSWWIAEDWCRVEVDEDAFLRLEVIAPKESFLDESAIQVGRIVHFGFIPHGIVPRIPVEVVDEPLGSFYGLEIPPPEIYPDLVELTDGGVTTSETDLRYEIFPPEYEASQVVVEILADDEITVDFAGDSLSASGKAILDRGIPLDANSEHAARVTLNRGTPIEMSSEPTPLPLEGQIIYRYDDPYTLSQDTDLAIELFCSEGTPFEFTISRTAKITLEFEQITDGGNSTSGEPITVLDNVQFEAGERSHRISLEDLEPGDYKGTIRAVDAEGIEEVREFEALAEYRVSDHRRLGQSVLQEVNLWKGNLGLSRRDISIPSRGADLEFTRSYSSSDSMIPGAMGVGWNHNWESRVEVTPCGEVVLIGGDGSGIRFTDDGSGDLTARAGNHGEMTADTEEFHIDYHSVGGMRYRYVPRSEGQWELATVTDPDGNVTQLTYGNSGADRLLIRVTDASDRQLQFTYEERQFVLWEGNVLTKVTGPGGIELKFDYDADGNLKSAEREFRVALEEYRYESVPSWDFEARRALTQTIDRLDGATNTYTYKAANIQAVADHPVSSLFVDSVRRPEQPGSAEEGKTRFAWDFSALAERRPAIHRVTDSRSQVSEYNFNNYGNLETAVDPLGNSTEMDWDQDNQVMTGLVDANETPSARTYDGNGNLLTETVTVTDFGGNTTTHTATNTYFDFNQPPYIRNLLQSRTDRNGNTTTFTYDDDGNLLSESITVTDIRGDSTTLTTTHTYAENGDRLTTTDPRGHVTRFLYDDYGYLETVIDPLGHRTLTRWDVRGRPVSITDANDQTTYMVYDKLDRLIRREFPDGGIETTDYFDALNLQVVTDPAGGITRTTRDREGRVVLIENAAGGRKEFEYDAEGNKILESRWFDGTTPRDDIVFEYDDAGRLIERLETLGRVTNFTYDGVGNVVSERLTSTVTSDGFVPRFTETVYDELNRPIEIRRQLGEGFVITQTRYDGEGNRLVEVDPLGRVSFFDYDELNRLIRSEENALRVRRNFYDGNSNLILTELDNSVNGELALQVREFVYDAANRRVAVIDALGVGSAVEYDGVGNVEREINRRGHVVRHRYDGMNRRIWTAVEIGSPPELVITEFDHDLNGNVIRETWPNDNIVTHSYDALDRLTRTEDSLGLVTAYVYDARGNRVRQTDAKNHETVNFYDVHDNLIAQELPADRTLEWSYDAADNLISETNARGFTTIYRFDALDRPIEIIDPLEHSTLIKYDAVGNKIQETDRRDHVTLFEYDDLNRLQLQTDPEIDGELFTTSMVYDAADNLVTEVDRRGMVTEYRYDLENRRTHTTRAGLLIEELEYDAEGHVVGSYDANRNHMTSEYDERGLLIARHRPLESTTLYEYDDMGDQTRMIDPEGLEITRTYDERRRLLTETRNDPAETTTYVYDGNGNRTSMERPEGGSWTYEYDDADRLVAVVNPEADRSEFIYDKNGNLETQTDGELRSTGLEYDELDRKTLTTYPDGAFETRDYDEAGNLIGMQDPKGQVASFTYDAWNREVLREYREDADALEVTEAIASTWDPNNNLLTVVESRLGETDAVTTHTYDDFDRIETVSDRWQNTLSYTYDANGNRTRLRDPNGIFTTYSYDALNRVASVLVPGSGTTQYEYLRNGLLSHVDYPNGTSAETTYDGSNRVATITNLHNSAVVSSFAYDYDNNGNRIEQVETHGGQAPETTIYAYDDADRLLQVTYPDKITAYTYDGAGNRLTEKETDLTGETMLSDKLYSYNDRNQLSSVDDLLDPTKTVTYGYDANGNRTSRLIASGQATQLAFDIRDRLIEVLEEGISAGSYGYDYQGLRITKTTADSVDRYVYDDQSVLLRTNEAGRSTKYDYGPFQLLSVDDSADGRGFYLFDALGSVSELTSSTGTVLGRYVWDAWGNKRSSVETGANPFGFTGHEHDEETGLVYAKARFYDPETGIFLTHDPVLGDPSNPPSLHRYLYAFQNPTVYVDPDGRIAVIQDFRERVLRRAREEVLEFAGKLEGPEASANPLVQAQNVRLATGAGTVAGILSLVDEVAGAANTAVNAAVLLVTSEGELAEQAATEIEEALQTAKRGIETIREDPAGVGTAVVTAAKDRLAAVASGDPRAIAESISDLVEIGSDVVFGSKGAKSALRITDDVIEAGVDSGARATRGSGTGAFKTTRHKRQAGKPTGQPTNLSRETFERLTFDSDKDKITPGSIEELRAGLAAERQGLIDRITKRGDAGADLVTKGGLEFDVKAPGADFLLDRKQFLKFKGRVNADLDLKILLDRRHVSDAELEAILRRAESAGIPRSRFLIPDVENFGPINVNGTIF